MSINLVQWEGSTVTPKLDAIMYDDGSYGIIKGCAITHQGTNLLKIANGFIKIAGRLIEIAEETIQCQVSASGTVNGQLWIRLDISSVTPAVFMTEAAAVLTPLTQNADCNFQNGIYELQLATYNIDESVITNLVETAPELERLRTALENIDLAANKVTYDNTHSGLSANKVQGAIDEINDNLSGFKYYPIGTQLVALVADDSFYTDANGKYVLADSPTGQTLLADTATYKASASTEDTHGEVGADTCSPFRKLEAVNPSRNNQPYEVPTIRLYRGKYTINVFGYKKLYLMFSANVTIPSSIISSVTFYDKDAQSISTLSFSATANTWTNSFDIPQNAMYLVFDLNNTWDKYITWSLEP
jgi:hypothetical protein